MIKRAVKNKHLTSSFGVLEVTRWLGN